MNAIVKSVSRGGPGLYALIVVALIIIGFNYISGMDAEAQEELLYFTQDFLPIIMFLSLAFAHFHLCFSFHFFLMLFDKLFETIHWVMHMLSFPYPNHHATNQKQYRGR